MVRSGDRPGEEVSDPLDNLFLLSSYVPVLFFMKDRNTWTGRWTGTWPSNATAKRSRGSLRPCSPCWGLWMPRFRGFRKPLHRAVLRVLRPAESAVRRLIVIAARGLVVKVAPSRPMPKGHVIGKGGGSRLPSFQLYDTRKYFPELRQRRVKYAKYPPRIHFFGPDSRWTPCGQCPSPLPLPPGRPMAWSMPNASPAGSRSSSWRSMICRARPGAWRAGG